MDKRSKKTNENLKLKKNYKEKKGSVFISFFKLLFNGIAIYFAISYLTTNSFFWGRKPPNWRRYIPVINKFYNIELKLKSKKIKKIIKKNEKREK